MTSQGTAVHHQIEQAECKHHWVIDAPSGPTSRGVCKNCGTEKQFKNFIDSAPWGEDSGGDHSRKYAASSAAPAPAPSGDEEEEAA